MSLSRHLCFTESTGNKPHARRYGGRKVHTSQAAQAVTRSRVEHAQKINTIAESLIRILALPFPCARTPRLLSTTTSWFISLPLYRLPVPIRSCTGILPHTKGHKWVVLDAACTPQRPPAHRHPHALPCTLFRTDGPIRAPHICVSVVLCVRCCPLTLAILRPAACPLACSSSFRPSMHMLLPIDTFVVSPVGDNTYAPTQLY
jgi:hypothetical protein